jgi:polyhydroxyalkanoate synthesis regulator phasin
VTERRGARRVSVGKAAVLLGISKDAVMTRVRHGTLRSEKTDDQMVHVWLSEALDSDRNTVPPQARVDASLQGKAEDIEELREQVRHLREVLAEERGIEGREDRIIAQLTQANASLAPLVPELKTPAPRKRPEPVKPPEVKTSQPQSAEPESKGPGKEARSWAKRARSRRSGAPAPDGEGASVVEGGEVTADSPKANLQTTSASRVSRLERRLRALRSRRQRPETLSALMLLTTEEIRRALVLTERAGVLQNGDVRYPEAFWQATPGELEALEHWRKLCGEPLDHLELAEELLDRMGEAHGWRSPEAMDAALFLQRLERPNRSPWFVARMAEAVLNFYAELGQHPGEPRHPRVRGAIRRLERLDELRLQDLAEQPGDPEAVAEGPPP